MDASYPNIQRNTQDALYRAEERPINVCGRIAIALGIIVVVGSLIANGCLYSQLSNYAFAIGASGIALGVLLMVLGWCASREPLEDRTVRQNVVEQQRNQEQSAQTNHRLANLDAKINKAKADNDAWVEAMLAELEAKKVEALKKADEDEKAWQKEEADRKEHAEKIKKEREEALAKKQAEQEARKNGPLDPDKFRTDNDYRVERLCNNNWYSNDSVKNQELIGYIDHFEFDSVKYDKLPDTVQKDFYVALMKGDVKKAEKFFSDRLSTNVINMMDESHIAILYGNGIRIFPYLQKNASKKLTPEMLKKLLKSILENWDLIPDIKKLASFTPDRTPKVEGFAIQLINRTAGLSPQEKIQEFERIFDLLMNTKFRPKLNPLLNELAKWRDLENGAILMDEFPLFFVQKIWQHPDKDAFFLALFTPILNLPILQNIIPKLTQAQKLAVKDVLAYHNANFKYHSQLDCFK